MSATEKTMTISAPDEIKANPHYGVAMAILQAVMEDERKTHFAAHAVVVQSEITKAMRDGASAEDVSTWIREQALGSLLANIAGKVTIDACENRRDRDGGFISAEDIEAGRRSRSDVFAFETVASIQCMSVDEFNGFMSSIVITVTAGLQAAYEAGQANPNGTAGEAKARVDADVRAAKDRMLKEAWDQAQAAFKPTGGNKLQ